MSLTKRLTMSPHDKDRMDRAIQCDLDDINSVRDAIVGLQSTDDPTLLPLHDLLQKRYNFLDNQLQKYIEEKMIREGKGDRL